MVGRFGAAGGLLLQRDGGRGVRAEGGTRGGSSARGRVPVRRQALSRRRHDSGFGPAGCSEKRSPRGAGAHRRGAHRRGARRRGARRGAVSYLGTPGGMPGGMRAGREGICGGAEKGSLLAAKMFWGPGREGMGGAAKDEGPPTGMGISGGPGVGPRTAGGRPGGRMAEGGLRCGGGLRRRGNPLSAASAASPRPSFPGGTEPESAAAPDPPTVGTPAPTCGRRWAAARCRRRAGARAWRRCWC